MTARAIDETAPLVETTGMTRVYRLGTTEVRALENLTVEIRRGEFVAIMGPSGSGKSTCMHLLGCLDRPTAGGYVLDGVDVSGLRLDALAGVRNEKIGFVFQSFSLLGRQTALENVEMPLLYAGVSRRIRRARAVAALDAVGLGDRLNHRPNQLSGGQQQRVAIARAIVNEPLLILADEPTGALDSRTGLEIIALLQSLNASGITIVVVTHDAELARFATRILSFRDGGLVGDERVEAPLSARAALERGVSGEAPCVPDAVQAPEVQPPDIPVAVSAPVATDPTATDPTATDPTATDPTATDPIVADPTAENPAPALAARELVDAAAWHDEEEDGAVIVLLPVSGASSAGAFHGSSARIRTE